MPRRGRIDFAGAFHHVMVRGVARSEIFRDDLDRRRFLSCLGEALSSAGTKCYAWALMPNHVHLLLRTGVEPLSHPMQRLLTRYAGWFNRRHDRSGHIFQNRYKSILGEEQEYLLALLRYVHLNPLRAGLVPDLQALGEYPWTGHAAMVGGGSADWHDTEYVLGLFGARETVARNLYSRFLAAGVGLKPPAMPKRAAESSEGRILGTGQFVEKVLKEVEGRDRRRAWLGVRLTPDEVVGRAAAAVGVGPHDLRTRSKRHPISEARYLACKWLVEDMGLPGVRAARIIGISETVVSRGVARGREIEARLGIKLEGSQGS